MLGIFDIGFLICEGWPGASECELELEMEFGRAREELGHLRRRKKEKRKISFAVVKFAVLSVIFIDFIGFWV
jgi:hypothetical protein